MALKELLDLLPSVTVEIQAAVSSSKWEALFSTNDPVANEEAGDVRAVLTQLSEMITDVDTIVANLSEGRKKLEAHKRKHANLISMVPRLPTEILSKIFILSSAIEVNFAFDIHCPAPIHHDFERGRDIVLNVAQVCQRWRNVAMYTPELWSLIAPFNVEMRTGRQLPNNTVELYARSSSFPIHFICKPTGPRELFATFDSSILDGLRQRCTGLDIDVTYWGQQHAQFDDVTSWVAGFTAVQRLTVKVLQEFPPDMFTRIPHFTTQLTHLYFVSEFGPTVDSGSIFRLQWSRLKCLIIEGLENIDNSTWHHLSTSAPVLEVLVIKGRVIELTGDGDDGGPLIHPHLRVLSLTSLAGIYYSMPHTDTSNLGRAFPSLSHLALSWNTEDDFRDRLAVALRRVARPLGSLTLCYGHEPPSGEQEDWLARLTGELEIESVEWKSWWHNWSFYAPIVERWYEPYVIAKATSSAS